MFRSLTQSALSTSAGLKQLGMPELRCKRSHQVNRIVSLINWRRRIVNKRSGERQTSHERWRRSEQQHRRLADDALDVINRCEASGRSSLISPSNEHARGGTVAAAIALQRTQDAVNQGQPLPSLLLELLWSHRNLTVPKPPAVHPEKLQRQEKQPQPDGQDSTEDAAMRRKETPRQKPADRSEARPWRSKLSIPSNHTRQPAPLNMCTTTKERSQRHETK